MFDNIFCEMNIKKVIHCGGAGGNGGTILISSWKCNYSIYLDIQAITTLLCLLLVLEVLVHSSVEVLVPTGFIVKNKQVHIQESLSQNYIYFFFYKFLKLSILSQKNMSIPKKSIKFIIHFFK